MVYPLDHLVVVVRDLDLAAQTFEAMGFTVTGVGVHPWGTRNRLVQFSNRVFIELLEVAEPEKIPPHEGNVFSFGAFNRDVLARRGEGMSMLALRGSSGAEDRDELEGRGVSVHAPFGFSRTATLPDGTTAPVGFDLTFAMSPARDMGFFTCAHIYPQNFWNETYMAHANHALAVTAVSIHAHEPPELTQFLLKTGGGGLICQGARHVAVSLGEGGAIEVLNDGAFADTTGDVPPQAEGPVFAAIAIKVERLEALRLRLEQHGIMHHIKGRRLVVPHRAAHGVTLLFSGGATP